MLGLEELNRRALFVAMNRLILCLVGGVAGDATLFFGVDSLHLAGCHQVLVALGLHLLAYPAGG